jgi:hypothetical protein
VSPRGVRERIRRIGQRSVAAQQRDVSRDADDDADRVDGDLSDEAWRTATRIDTWYETMPGDNNDPPVKSVGYLIYDDRIFYVGLAFENPNPSAIRAPLGDRDSIRGSRIIIGQYVATSRDPLLFVSNVDTRSGTFSGSALFAYKLNGQSVMFVGYGDNREMSDARRVEKLDRQFFVKLSYAFQR